MSQEVKILGWGTIYVYYNISQTTEAISGIYCKVFPDEIVRKARASSIENGQGWRKASNPAKARPQSECSEDASAIATEAEWELYLLRCHCWLWA